MDGMDLGSGEGREYDGGELPVELPGRRILPGEPEQGGSVRHGAHLYGIINRYTFDDAW